MDQVHLHQQWLAGQVWGGRHLRPPVGNKGGNSQAGDGNNFAQTSTCHLSELVLDNRLVIWGMCPCSNRALGALVNGKDLDNLPELLICSQQYHGFRGSRLGEFSACCSYSKRKTHRFWIHWCLWGTIQNILILCSKMQGTILLQPIFDCNQTKGRLFRMWKEFFLHMAEAERAKVLRTFLLTRVDEFRFP